MKLVRLGVAACLLCAMPFIAMGQPAGEVASSAVEIVLALPFENAGSAGGFSWIGEGLGELSARRLAGANRVVLPRGEWRVAAERLGLGPSPRMSRASLLKVARETDADYAIFGSFQVEGRQLTITAHGLRLSGPALSPAIVESGPLEQIAQIHARACWRVLEFFDPMLIVSRRDYLQQAPPLKLAAFENYVRGLLALGADRIRLLREATRLDPEWPDPAFALGQSYFEEGNFDEALIWFSRVPPASAFGLEAGFFSGVCHLMRNDARRAEAALRAIVERPWYPGSSAPAARRMDLPEVLNNLAIALSRQGKWEEAAALWEQVRRLAPVEPAFAFNHGLGALRAAAFDTAIAALREALRLRADDETRVLLATALERAGHKEQARAERAACESRDCGASDEVKALLASATAPPAAAANLDRVSTSLDLLTWFLTGQSREAGTANGGGKSTREETRPPPTH